jgi:fumarate hydratase class I
MSIYTHHEMFPLKETDTPWKKLTSDYVEAVNFEGQTLLKVEPQGLSLLSAEAFKDISHLLRPEHLAQLAKILEDPEASNNDRFVALDLLKNANISAGGILPMCQDTGTAIIMGKKGANVWTNGQDEAALAEGILKTFTETNLRYSQVAPIDLFTEINTGNNLPAQIEIYSDKGEAYNFLFIAKGGGSANKTFLFQETKALLNPESLTQFLDEKIRTLGTAAELTLKTVKLASCKYLDTLPTQGNKFGQAFRDLEWEQKIHKLTQSLGIGAQFGGKYFCHDVRVIRLPRHGASCPVGIGVSCSADRQAMGKITVDGIYLEKLETDPSQYLPEVTDKHLDGEVLTINLNRPMREVLAELSEYPVKTRLSLNGSLIVARDIAHAKIKERLDTGHGLPEYFKNYGIYYAGPAKRPDGLTSGSFGPTTAGRMDSYVDQFQAAGGSMIMLAKGNRSQQVTEACKKYGGFYLGSVGGPGARLAQDCITSIKLLEYEELGMEAIWKIEIKNFPAFIIVDNKGNDFFAEFTAPMQND